MLKRGDAQLERINTTFETIHRRPSPRRLVPTRSMLEAVLWIPNTGASSKCERQVLRQARADFANELGATKRQPPRELASITMLLR
jgi:hypothetical protein